MPRLIVERRLPLEGNTILSRPDGNVLTCDAFTASDCASRPDDHPRAQRWVVIGSDETVDNFVGRLCEESALAAWEKARNIVNLLFGPAYDAYFDRPRFDRFWIDHCAPD